MIGLNLGIKKTTQILSWAAVVLTFIHIFFKVIFFTTGHNYVYGIMPFFGMDNEGTIPTMFSAYLFSTCFCFLFLIAQITKKQQGRYYLHWLFLSFLFIYLALDEAIAIHEFIGQQISHRFEMNGILLYAWIVPYGCMIIVLMGLYFNWFIHLPQMTKIQFSLSGAIFLLGSMGLEMLEGYYHQLHGFMSITYQSLVTVEECLEMAGLIFFINALMKYIKNQFPDLSVSIV